MGALTEVYVNPALNSNSGAGTLADPYGDLQHALNTHARDSTNGNRFNIKAGVDEVQTAPISLTTFGNPTNAAPLVFQGYANVAGDGGFGGISGGGSVTVYSGTGLIVYFRHLNLHNSGSQSIVTSSHVVECKIYNTTGIGVSIGSNFVIRSCEITDCGTGANIGSGGYIADCWFKNGGIRNFTNAVISQGGVHRCMFSLSGASNGVQASTGCRIEQCSFLCAGGTGAGIISGGGTPTVLNNIFEGFSGVGGRGIGFVSGDLAAYGGNAFFNNATHAVFDIAHIDLGGNEVLTSSPFAKIGADTFANRFNYFAPNNVGNVLGGAYVG